MTIKELYDWAVENDAEDLELSVQYQDGYFSYQDGSEVEVLDIKRKKGYVLIG